MKKKSTKFVVDDNVIISFVDSNSVHDYVRNMIANGSISAELLSLTWQPNMERMLFDEAMELKRNKLYKLAYEIISFIVSKCQGNVLYVLELANILKLDNKITESLDVYNAAINMYPDSAILAIDFAKTLWMMGKLEPMIEHAERAHRLMEGDVYIACAYSAMLRACGEPLRAIEVLLKVLRHNKDNSDIILQLTKSLYQARKSNFIIANNELGRLINKDLRKQNPELDLELVILYSNPVEVASFAKKTRELLKRNPSYLVVYLKALEACLEDNKDLITIDALKSFDNLDATDYITLVLLTELNFKVNRYDVCLQYSRKLISLFPKLQIGYAFAESSCIELKKYNDLTTIYLSKPSFDSVAPYGRSNYPPGFPDDMIIPAIKGEGNDYSFIEELARKYVYEGNPYIHYVTIVIPTYHCGAQLANTLAALEQQTYPKHLMEVVVVDLGPDYKIEEIIYKYESRLDVIYMRHGRKQHGLGDIVNIAIRIAKHNYIIQLDDCMLPYPDLVEAYMRYFHVVDNAMLIGCGRNVKSINISDDDICNDINIVLSLPRINADDDVLGMHQSEWTFIDDCLNGNYLKRELRPYSKVTQGNIAYSKELFQKIGGYNEQLQSWSDAGVEMAYRFYNAGGYFIPVINAFALRQVNNEKIGETQKNSVVNKEMLIEYCPTLNHRKRHRKKIYKVPKVSIYIPAYNSGLYIQEAIESALNQTFTDLEVCVCDDGSTDSTPYILEQYYKTNPRVKWVSQCNGGIGKASNTAVKMCRGMYIGQLDADDVLHPTAIEKCVQYLDDNPAGCVYTSCNLIDKDGKYVRDGWRHLGFSREWLLTYMIVNHFRMFRRRDWMRTVGFAEDIINAVDIDMYLKLSEVCAFHHINEVLYSYRYHGENTTVRNNKEQQQNHIEVINRGLARMGLGKQWAARNAGGHSSTVQFVKIN